MNGDIAVTEDMINGWGARNGSDRCKWTDGNFNGGACELCIMNMKGTTANIPKNMINCNAYNRQGKLNGHMVIPEMRLVIAVLIALLMILQLGA